VAPATLNRWAWPLAAALAAAFVVWLSLHGERPKLIHETEENGVMRNVDLATVTWVEVNAGNGHWRFVRKPGESWSLADGAPAPPPDFAGHIELGLRLLHDSAPQRLIAAEDAEGLDPAQFGLARPALTVSLGSDGTKRFTAAFGTANPMGLANYVRVDSRTEIALVNDYVLDTWKQAVGAP
jgi:hypothetical protein